MIITVTMNPAIDKTIETDRLCPGALHRIRNMAWDAGGKGINVSKTIRELGEKSIATGFLGGNAGKAIADSLSERGIEHDFIWLEGETRTNTKVLEADGRVTELNEPGPEVRGEQMEQLLEKLAGYAGYAGKGTLFVLSGSLPSGADKQVYARIIRMAHEKGAEVLLDADGEAFRNALKAGPDIIKPNRAELRECAGFYGWLQEAPEGCGEAGYGEPFRKAEAGYGEFFRATGGESGRIGGYPAASLKRLLAAAEKCRERGAGMVVVSMGSEGALFVKDGYEAYAPAIPVRAHSTVGAGDAMVAALACAWNQRLGNEETVRLCMAAAAGAVTTVGTKPPKRELVEELMEKVLRIREI